MTIGFINDLYLPNEKNWGNKIQYICYIYHNIYMIKEHYVCIMLVYLPLKGKPLWIFRFLLPFNNSWNT